MTGHGACRTARRVVVPRTIPSKKCRRGAPSTMRSHPSCGCERDDFLGRVSVPHQLADAAALALFGGNPVANVRRGLVRTAFIHIEGRDGGVEAGAQIGGQAERVARDVRAIDRTQNLTNRSRRRAADREQRDRAFAQDPLGHRTQHPVVETACGRGCPLRPGRHGCSPSDPLWHPPAAHRPRGFPPPRRRRRVSTLRTPSDSAPASPMDSRNWLSSSARRPSVK